MTDISTSAPAPASVAPAPQAISYRRYALALLVAIYTVNFLDRQIVTILIPNIKASLQLNDTEVGAMAGTWFALLYTVLGIPIARYADKGDTLEVTVPAGNYLMIGDNRDNSDDGRYWGFVPEENLVGSARRVWLNFDRKRSPMINWGRIGTKID